MALLNANNLGVFIQTGSLQTTPYLVGKSDPAADDDVAEAALDLAIAGGRVAATTYKGFLVHGDNRVLHEQSNSQLTGLSNSKPAFVSVTTNSADPVTVASGSDLTANLDLAAAATSCSLETSLSIDETVAKSNVVCKSETYTTPGTVSWSITTDGLLETTQDASKASANEIMKIAQRQQYIVVRFSLDVNNDDLVDSASEQENVSYIGQGLIETFNVSGGFDEFTTYSVTIRGYGKLYKYFNE